MKNGVHFDPSSGEYQIWLDGELITWASTEPVGERIYTEALQTKCKHTKHTEQPTFELHTLTPQVIEALEMASIQ